MAKSDEMLRKLEDWLEAAARSSSTSFTRQRATRESAQITTSSSEQAAPRKVATKRDKSATVSSPSSSRRKGTKKDSTITTHSPKLPSRRKVIKESDMIAASGKLEPSSDRYDWRQTAVSFRKARLANAHKTRKEVSDDPLAMQNTRAVDVQARVQAYQAKIIHLVELERAHEKAEWKRLRSRSVEELVAGGWTLDGLVGYWQGGSGSGPSTRRQWEKRLSASTRPKVAILSRTGLQKLGWTRLKVGEMVELRPSGETDKTIEDYMPKEETVVSLLQEKSDSRLFASVLFSDAYRLRLLFAPPHSFVDLEACPSWRLDLAPHDAIDAKVDETIDNLAIDPAAVEMKDLEGKVQIKGSSLTEALIPRTNIQQFDAVSDAGPASVFEPDWRIRSWYERYSRSDPLIVEGDPELNLNASQLKAVATMLSSRLSLIQGPPGTGKTHTLVSTIRLLKHHFAVPHPVLLCAHTNVAVDNLVDGCIKAGLNVVRVGPDNDVSSMKNHRIQEVTLQRKMEQSSLWPKVEETRRRLDLNKRKIAALYERENRRDKHDSENNDAEYGAVSAQREGAFDEAPARKKESPQAPNVRGELGELFKTYGHLRRQENRLTRQIQTTLLYEADVVCSTLISSSSAPMKGIDLPLVFIDECTQALEELSLMPLMKGSRQVALIGDHKQLPPVLKSHKAKREGGARSLFERLVEEDGWATQHETDENTSSAFSSGAPFRQRRTKMQMLQVQHRMHPALASFPNYQFYAGQLQSAARTNDVPAISHSLATSHAALNGTGRLVFIDHKGLESVTYSGSEVSLSNAGEIEVLMHLLYDLLSQKQGGDGGQLSGSSIGIISPYLAQTRSLRRLLRPLTEEDTTHPLRRALEVKLSPRELQELEKVEVNTVDGFQGREKDVIIFSAVRCRISSLSPASAEPSDDNEMVLQRAETDAIGNFASTGTTNPEGRRSKVGFLADARRLNVALTRAKSALFVLGNAQTWRTSDNFSASPSPSSPTNSASRPSPSVLCNFVKHVDRHGTMISGDEVRRIVGLLPPGSTTVEEQGINEGWAAAEGGHAYWENDMKKSGDGQGDVFGNAF